MSTVKRKLIRSEPYQGHTLEARYMGPDLLAFVDGTELGSFYIDAQAAVDGGKRFVDADIKAQQDKTDKAARESKR